MAKTQDVPSRDAKRRWTASGRSSCGCVACCGAKVKGIARTTLRRMGPEVQQNLMLQQRGDRGTRLGQDLNRSEIARQLCPIGCTSTA
jgi:hypothetical protein